MSPLFLAHGLPMLAIEDNEYTQFLASIGAGIKPDAVFYSTLGNGINDN